MAKSVIIQTQENAAKIIVDGNEISDVLSYTLHEDSSGAKLMLEIAAADAVDVNSEHVPKAEQANSCATSANCGRSIPEICGEMQSTLREHLKSETELHMLMHELLIALSKPRAG